MGVRTLIKRYALLGKRALACYKLLKGSLGTHAASYETVHHWVNVIKNGQEETDNAPPSGAPALATGSEICP
jgi:hypothetical protein